MQHLGVVIDVTGELNPVRETIARNTRRERRGLVLVLSGHYPLPAGKVPFQVRYWYRDNGWGLHAVLVRAPGSSDIPLPPEREPEFTR